MPEEKSGNRRELHQIIWGVFLAALLAVVWFYDRPSSQSDYVQVAYEDLPGWSEDRHAEALGAFIKSCEKENIALKHWASLCDQARVTAQGSEADLPSAARLFFEENFSALGFGQEEDGLFTGYYAPEYEGSLVRTDEFIYPLYGLPQDMQRLALGDFDHSLKGRSIVGRVKDGKFIPYSARTAIDQGALKGQGLELVWLKDPADAFFLHIQGSGRILFADGSRMMLGYAGKNGRPYRAVGRFLIESGDIAAENMSMQAIRQWMVDHPERTEDLMWKNPSYIFFHKLDSSAPVGTLGVGLTPGRSIAVDRAHIPLGLPVWLDIPQKDAAPIRRLVMAQDTGGAIKGRVRADLYWGIGPQAAMRAGPMKEKGILYMLVPNRLAEQLLKGQTSLIHEAP